MPFPNTTASVIVIAQTSGSAVGGEFRFIERQISGSNLFLITDASGNLTGSATIPIGNFTNLIVTGALTASVISASTAITSAAITSGPITASNISASGFVSASVLVGAHTGSTFGTSSWAINALTASSLVTTNTYQVANINIGTPSQLNSSRVSIADSAFKTSPGNCLTFATATGGFTDFQLIISRGANTSGYYAFQAVEHGIGYKNIVFNQDGGNVGVGTTNPANKLSVIGAVNIGSSGYNTAAPANGLIVEGSVGIGVTNPSAKLQVAGNVSGSSFTSSISNAVGFLGTSSWANNSLTASLLLGSVVSASFATTASSLVTTNNYVINNLTASNISSSGTISGSDGWFNNLTVPGTLTATISGSITTANSSSIANTNAATVQYITFVDGTGNRPILIDQDGLAYIPFTNTLSASGAVSASAFFASGDVAINGGNITTNALTFSLVAANATTINIGTGAATGITIGNASTQTSIPGLISNSNGTVATIGGTGAIVTAGGVYIGKNLIVSGSTTLLGDVTMFGTGSIINISSSNIIIGDNRIQLNAWSVGAPQRYGGIDIFDSGSSAAVTSSILWDSLNNYWLLQTNATGSPATSSSAIILQGPTSSFGNEYLLTVNNFLKVQTPTGNMITSSLSEFGTTLQYNGVISASVVSGSTIYGTTGSFVNLTVVTGSSPNTGSQVPTGPNASGMPGQIEVDNNFIYVYTNNVWKRVPLSVWIG